MSQEQSPSASRSGFGLGVSHKAQNCPQESLGGFCCAAEAAVPRAHVWVSIQASDLSCPSAAGALWHLHIHSWPSEPVHLPGPSAHHVGHQHFAVVPVLCRSCWYSLGPLNSVHAHLSRAHVLASGSTTVVISIFV